MADKLKKPGEAKGLSQKEIYNEIGLRTVHYNELEKGLAESSLEILINWLSFMVFLFDSFLRLMTWKKS